MKILYLRSIISISHFRKRNHGKILGSNEETCQPAMQVIQMNAYNRNATKKLFVSGHKNEL